MEKSFLSGISGNEKMLPMFIWGRLLEKAQITLNMISTSRCTENISAHTMMEGNFDFSKTLLAPPGTKVIGN